MSGTVEAWCLREEELTLHGFPSHTIEIKVNSPHARVERVYGQVCAVAIVRDDMDGEMLHSVTVLVCPYAGRVCAAPKSGRFLGSFLDAQYQQRRFAAFAVNPQFAAKSRAVAQNGEREQQPSHSPRPAR